MQKCEDYYDSKVEIIWQLKEESEETYHVSLGEGRQQTWVLRIRTSTEVRCLLSS